MMSIDCREAARGLRRLSATPDVNSSKIKVFKKKLIFNGS